MDTTISRTSTGQALQHRGWSVARAALLDAARAGPGLTVLLGPAGTGKSLMLIELERTLRQQGVAVVLLHRGDTVLESGTPEVLLVDEADRLAPDILQAFAASPSAAIILAALPSLASRLHHLDAVRTVALQPLDDAESATLVAARLMQGGYPPDLLTAAAVAELIRLSSGVPRVLHTLLGLSIFAASLDDSPFVTPAHVADAVLFRDGDYGPPAAEPPETAVPAAVPPTVAPESAVVPPPPPPKPRRVGWRVLVALAMIVLAAAGLVVSRPGLLPEAGPLPVVQPATAALPSQAAPRPEPALPPQAPAPPAPAVSLPPGSLIRIVVGYPAGDTGAAREAAVVTDTLRAHGITAGEPLPLGAGRGAPALLYYFPEDLAGARDVSQTLGTRFGDPIFARLPARSPLPRPGTIEIVLAPSPP